MARFVHSLFDESGPQPEVIIRTLTVSLLGAAALAAGLLLVRQQRREDAERPSLVPAGEQVPAVISLEKLRELGY